MNTYNIYTALSIQLLYYLPAYLRPPDLHEADVCGEARDAEEAEGGGLGHGGVLQLPGQALHQVHRGAPQLLRDAGVHHAVGRPAHRAQHQLALGVVSVAGLHDPGDLATLQL